jgi:hypothetical protein
MFVWTRRRPRLFSGYVQFPGATYIDHLFLPPARLRRQRPILDDETVNLDSAADNLYALTPDEFTSARSTCEKQAKSDGDRALAAAIHKLRRPSASAWLANQLSRQHVEELSELLELGEAMRAATSQLRGSTLRELSKQRQQIVHALTALARRSALDAGHRVSDSAARELEQTLHAALADPIAADELSAGRLTRALASDGFGSISLNRSEASGPANSYETAQQHDSERDEQRAHAAVVLTAANAERETAAAELRQSVATEAEASTVADKLTAQLEGAHFALSAAREARQSAEAAVERAEQKAADAAYQLTALE